MCPRDSLSMSFYKIIKTNVLQYIGFYIEIVGAKVLFDQICEGLIIDSLIMELKVGSQYTQAIPIREGFPSPVNTIIVVGYDAWSNS